MINTSSLSAQEKSPQNITTSFQWKQRLMHTQPGRMFLFGWLGILGFPFYYWLWAEVFPQPYENLSLRIIGMLICLPFMFSLIIGEKLWVKIYFYLVFTYALPFFFTFMYLMNDASPAWAQSLVIMVAVIFSFDLKIALLSGFTGITIAIISYLLQPGDSSLYFISNIQENIPTLIFSILAAVIIKATRQSSNDEKLSALATGISTAAHELRNPLASIVIYISAIEKHISSHQKDILIHKADNNSKDLFHKSMLLKNQDNLHNKILEGINLLKNQVFYSNSMINILVTNAWKGKNKIQSKNRLDIGASVQTAIDLYPFFNPNQRKIINLNLEKGIYINGDEKLFTLIIHNLIKNSFKAIARGPHKNGLIIIETKKDKNNYPCILFKDNGCGIKKAYISHLFQRFFSYPSGSGTGIGLAFCRDVLNEWGANITCTSQENAYTEFTLVFPAATNP